MVDKATHFTPWRDDAHRSCRTCAHGCGTSGNEMWCTLIQRVVVNPCGSWERGDGCDEPEPDAGQ